MYNGVISAWYIQTHSETDVHDPAVESQTLPERSCPRLVSEAVPLIVERSRFAAWSCAISSRSTLGSLSNCSRIERGLRSRWYRTTLFACITHVCRASKPCSSIWECCNRITISWTHHVGSSRQKERTQTPAGIGSVDRRVGGNHTAQAGIWLM